MLMMITAALEINGYYFFLVVNVGKFSVDKTTEKVNKSLYRAATLPA